MIYIRYDVPRIGFVSQVIQDADIKSFRLDQYATDVVFIEVDGVFEQIISSQFSNLIRCIGLNYDHPVRYYGDTAKFIVGNFNGLLDNTFVQGQIYRLLEGRQKAK